MSEMTNTLEKQRRGLEMELTTIQRHLQVYEASRTQRPYYEALFLGKLQELQDTFGPEAGRPFREFYVRYQRW